MNITPNESIFCQALAITSLLGELYNKNFLQSEYYQNLKFSQNNENFKNILNVSGLGNPATMQMFLYVLLVMPKEILKEFDATYEEQCETEINQLFLTSVFNVITTYGNESNSDLSSINFYRHTRNAVSHSRCFYDEVDDGYYMTFKDQNPQDANKYCEYTIKTADVGKILEKRKEQIMIYLNSQWSMRKN